MSYDSFEYSNDYFLTIWLFGDLWHKVYPDRQKSFRLCNKHMKFFIKCNTSSPGRQIHTRWVRIVYYFQYTEYQKKKTKTWWAHTFVKSQLNIKSEKREFDLQHSRKQNRDTNNRRDRPAYTVSWEMLSSSTANNMNSDFTQDNVVHFIIIKAQTVVDT